MEHDVKYKMSFPNSETREQYAPQFNEYLHDLNLMNYSVAADLIVYRLKLETPFTLYKQFVESAGLPYHNLYHTECMIANVFEGSVYENTPTKYWRPLVLAAICHDAFHSGGDFSDDINIARALDFLEACINMSKYSKSNIDISKFEGDHARAIIKITQYPYIGEPKTIDEEIIRDADLMQPYEADDGKLVKQYLGLWAEMENMKNRKFSAAEFAEGNRQFFDGVVWHTAWAKQKAIKLNWASHLDRLIHTIVNL